MFSNLVCELKICYTTTCRGMLASAATSAGGCGIVAEWTGNTGGSGIIYVSSWTMGGCLGGSPNCGRLMNGWDSM